MKTYSTANLLFDLQKRVERSSQKETARELQVSTQFLNDVLRGRREITDRLAMAMGFERAETVYVKKKDAGIAAIR